MSHPPNRHCSQCGGLAYCVDRDIKRLGGIVPVGSTLTYACKRCVQGFRVKSAGLLVTYLVVALAGLAVAAYEGGGGTAWMGAAVALGCTAVVVHGLFMHGRSPTIS